VVVTVLVSAVGCDTKKVESAAGGEAAETIAIPLRAVVADAGQNAVSFPALEVRGSPAHVVRRLLRQAEDSFNAEQTALRDELQQLQRDDATVKAKLDGVRESIAREFNAAAPRESDTSLKARNPLEGISKARTAKNKLAELYAAAFSERVAPVEDEVRRLEEEIVAVNARIDALRKSYTSRLFDALPSAPHGQWKTDAQGNGILKVPRGEPWFVWASAVRQVATTREIQGQTDQTGQFRATVREGGIKSEVYRWLMLVPDQVDASGQLSLDQQNLFDGRVMSTGPRRGDSSTNLAPWSQD
jgi:hypothetical protein